MTNHYNIPSLVIFLKSDFLNFFFILIPEWFILCTKCIAGDKAVNQMIVWTEYVFMLHVTAIYYERLSDSDIFPLFHNMAP